MSWNSWKDEPSMRRSPGETLSIAETSGTVETSLQIDMRKRAHGGSSKLLGALGGAALVFLTATVCFSQMLPPGQLPPGPPPAPGQLGPAPKTLPKNAAEPPPKSTDSAAN